MTILKKYLRRLQTSLDVIRHSHATTASPAAACVAPSLVSCLRNDRAPPQNLHYSTFALRTRPSAAGGVFDPSLRLLTSNFPHLAHRCSRRPTVILDREALQRGRGSLSFRKQLAKTFRRTFITPASEVHSYHLRTKII